MNSMKENLLPAEKFDRKILIKVEEEGKFGIKPENRPVEQIMNYGIINIDKPKGPTSHQVSDYLQKILHISKSGHSGTLDPAVTGCLTIATGKATRIVQALLSAGKEYVALMHLHHEIDTKTIKKAFKKMTGTIRQLPPIKSAVKRQYRYRKIYYIEILEIEGQDVLFKIGCEAGTYIRKYIHDFGELVGTGAHMQELRRSKVGPFNEETLVTLQDLTDAYFYWKEEKKEDLLRKYIQPIESATVHLPKVWVSDSAIKSLVNGASLNIPGVVKLHDQIEPDQMVAVMTLKNELIALGKSKLTSKKILEQEKGIAVNISKVFYN